MTKEDVLAEVYLSCRGWLSFLVGPIVGYQNAKDVIQDAFLKVLKSHPEFPEPVDARRYVRRVAINTALDLAKERSRLLPIEEQDGPWQIADSNPLSELIKVEEEKQRDRLFRKALPLLERICQRRGVPVDLFLDGKCGKLTDCSQRLGVPISTLRSRYLTVQREVRVALRFGVGRCP